MSPTDCAASLSVIKKPRERGGHSPRWAGEPAKIIIITIIISSFNKQVLHISNVYTFYYKSYIRSRKLDRNWCLILSNKNVIPVCFTFSEILSVFLPAKLTSGEDVSVHGT
jgi:hypothetical protein